MLRRILDSRDPGLFTQNPGRALRVLIDQAVAQLEAAPMARLQDKFTWRELGAEIFADSNKSYSETFQEIRTGCGEPLLSEKTVQRAIEDLRDRLAAILQRMEISDRHFVLAEDPEYVSRPDLEKRFSEVLSSGERLVLIHGEAGTGKTTLALHLTRSFLRFAAHDWIPVIPFQEGGKGPVEDSFREMLDRHGFAVSDVGVSELVVTFRKLVTSETPPPVVVLDNIDSRTELERFVPPGVRSRIIITSRKNLDSKVVNIAPIEVMNMANDEAVQLVSLHSQGLQEDGKKYLAEALDFRPLAIVHGCACLINAPYNGDLTAFLESLRENVAVVLESYGDDEDTTITAIYRMIVDALKRQPQYVLLALDLVILAYPVRSVQEALRLSWPPSDVVEGQISKELNLEDEAILSKGLRIIERWNLVHPNALPFLHIHSLTRELVASIRGDALAAVAVQAYRVASHRLNLSSWMGGAPIPSSWPQEVEYMLASFDISARGSAVRTGIAFSQGDETDPLCQVPALFLRRGRQREEMSAEAVNGARSVLSEPWSRRFTALETEALELGILDEVGDVLNTVRARRPDAYVYEALLSSDLRPLTEAYTTDVIEDARWHIDHPLATEMPLTPAQHSYALGVFHFQRCEWKEAEACYMQSSEFYKLLASEKAEFGLYALEAGRRLADLDLRRGDLNSANERIYALLSEVFELGKSGIVDAFLSRRITQTGLRIQSERMLRGAPSGGNIDQLLALYQDLMLKFAKTGSSLPLLEVEFARAVMTALVDNKQANRMLTDLGSRCRDSGYKVGTTVCMATQLKVIIAVHAGTAKPARFAQLAEWALSLAEDFVEVSRFWHADVLCSALACAILGDVPDRRAEEIRSRAQEAASLISRPDKMTVAEKVGGVPPYFLLRE